MAHTGCPWGNRSPNTCKNRWDHQRPSQAGQLIQGLDANDDWETDPDCVNNASRQWGDHEIATASIISDLSRSIRECSLGTSNSPRKKDYAHHQSHLQSYKDSAQNRIKDPERHQPPLCPHMHSSPSLGIERSSLFNRNAAEKLDTFFSEKLKAWASDSAHLSDSCENMGPPPEEPAGHSRPRRSSKKEHAGTAQISRRQSHSRAIQRRGDVAAEFACSSRDNYDISTGHNLCPRHLRHDPAGKGRTSESPLWRQDNSRPSTTVSSSAWILPQCRISHVQSCRACQAFNRDAPVGREAVHENCWSPLEEEDKGDMSTPRQKERTGPPCQRQTPDRFSKVQQWLEQTPAEDPPGHPRRQRHGVTRLASSGARGWSPASGPLNQKERDPWDRAGDAGDCPSLEPPAESRRRKKTHGEENPNHQPAARIQACDDASTSPATCSCLFCEQQRPRAKVVSSKKRPDPSVEEVARQLQAENRVPRIVEAFERRSLREAKIVDQERACQSARQRELEKKSGRLAKSRGDTRRGHQASGTKTRTSRAKEREVQPPPPQPSEEPRPRLVPEGHPKHSKAKERLGKQPSFMDRLRGLC